MPICVSGSAIKAAAVEFRTDSKKLIAVCAYEVAP
jgi:hypothetical protein